MSDYQYTDADAPVDESSPRKDVPWSLEAEQSALGSMMLSRDALEDVMAVVQPDHFFLPKHETIARAIGALVARNEPVDVLTVGDELQKHGALGRAGGAAYLHELTGIPVTTANAGHHAQIVNDHARRRVLLEVGMQITTKAYASEGTVDELEDAARRALDAATSRAGRSVRRIGDALDDIVDTLDAKPEFYPTPWAPIDKLIGGFAPGSLVVVAARPGQGKALDVATPIPTPTGWTTMGEVRVGDYVLGADGRAARVVFATEEQHGRRCYEVKFSDGSSIVADGDHLWLTETRAERRAASPAASVRTTDQIRATLRTETADARLNHAVRVAAPVRGKAVKLPIDPYILGYWLGDGMAAHAQLAVAAGDLSHIVGELTERGFHYRVTPEPSGVQRVSFSTVLLGNHHGSKAALRELGLIGNKHIPDLYLRASEAQRRDLLAGLMDSDGTIDATGLAQFGTTSELLDQGFYELLVSLGMQGRRRIKRVRGRNETTSAFRITTFRPEQPVFRLPRKASRVREVGRSTNRLRYITAIEPVASRPVRCIQVENDDHMYLAGRSMIPTHNTIALMQAAVKLARQGMVAFSSLEMTEAELGVRLLSYLGEIPMQSLRNHSLTDMEWKRIAETRRVAREAPIFVNDAGGQTLASIRQHARAVARRGKLTGIAVDYLQLVQGEGSDRRVVVDSISRGLKQIAKDFNVPVLAAAQLNRPQQARGGPVEPTLASLREAGGIEQDADVVILLHRDADKHPRDIKFIVAKNRHGELGAVKLAWEAHFARFVEKPWTPTHHLYEES